MNKTTIHAIAQRALEELMYEGWSVSAVWQQKTLSNVQSSEAKVNALKTWCIDYTNKQGSFPRVYFRCEPEVTEEWVREEIKRQLNGLQQRLAFMDPARAAQSNGSVRQPQQEQQQRRPPSPSAKVSSAETSADGWAEHQTVDFAQDAAPLRATRPSGESVLLIQEEIKAASSFVDDLTTEAAQTKSSQEILTDAAAFAAVIPHQAKTTEEGQAQPKILVPSADLTKRRSASFYIGAALLGAFAGLIVYLASLYVSRTEPLRNISGHATTGESPSKVGTAANQHQSVAPAISLSAGPTPQTSFAERTTDDAATVLSAPGEESSSESSNSRKEKGGSQTNRALGSPTRAALRSALNAWAAANKNRDIKKQMSFYAPQVNTFYQERDVSRPEVEAEKTKLNEQAQAADVRTDQPEIIVDKAGATATTRFKKRYAIAEKEGGTVRRGEVIQELRWRKTDAGWKIVSERDIEAAP